MMKTRTLAFQGFIILSLLVAMGSIGCARSYDDHRVIELTVERVPKLRSFRVSWKAERAVSALVFTRNIGGHRARSWLAQDEGLRFESIDGRERLVSQEKRNVFEVLIPERIYDVAGDYPLLSKYSDGGVVFYSGHLDAAAVDCPQGCSSEAFDKLSSAPERLVLVAAPGENAIGDGKSGPVVSLSPTPDGSFVYFGRQTLEKGKGFRAVLDPGLPAWVWPELKEYFPQFIDLNTRKLGRSLNGEPTLFVPFQTGLSRSTLRRTGAVVSTQVLIGLSGERWNQRTPGAREELLSLLAHETFHLWNASLFHSIAKVGGHWLHEGGADAMAFISLMEVGAVSKNRYMSLQSESLNRCLVGLIGTDLPSSNSPWAIRNHYNCGAVVQYLVKQVLMKRNSSLWTLWRRVFNHAVMEGGFYTHDKFMSLVDSEAQDPLLLKAILDITTGSVNGAGRTSGLQLEAFFMNAFKSAGVTLAASDRNWPDWYHNLVAERALASILEADCGGEGSFIFENGKARMIGSSSCRTLREDADVTHIGEYRLWSDGVRAYDHARHICSVQSHLDLLEAGREKRLRFKCPQLPKRPRFVTFSWMESE